jgi:ligand-binding sensor domain-containing protein
MKACPSWAQLDPNKLTHFPELDGNLIHDIITDQEGVVWIATQSGLITFDGYEYKRYHPIVGDTTTIGTVLTTQLYLDDHGNIWVGCMYDLYKFNPKTRSFKRYPHTHLTDFHESRQPVISSISTDNNGRIYFGVVSFNGGNCTNGLIYYDEEQDSVLSFPIPEEFILDRVYMVDADVAGNVWIISEAGYFKLDPDGRISPVTTLENLLQDEFSFVNGLKSARDGSLWGTTNRARVFHLDPNSDELKHWSMDHLFDPGEFLYYGMNIQLDSNQNLWIPSHKGLIFFDVQKEQFEVFPGAHEDRVQSDFINSLHLDSFNNLWIGLQSAGMLKYTDKKMMQSIVHALNNEAGLTYGWAQKIIEQSNGDLWLATFGGIHRFDPVTGELNVVHAYSLDSNMWRANVLIEYVPGSLLLHTNLGVGVYSTDQAIFQRLEKPFAPDSVNIITASKDQSGNIWIGTNNGIYVVDTSLRLKQHFDMMEFGGTSIASNLIADFMHGSGKDMWVSTNDGLFLYEGDTKTFERHAYDPSRGDVIDVQDINSLYVEPEGRVWIGT